MGQENTMSIAAGSSKMWSIGSTGLCKDRDMEDVIYGLLLIHTDLACHFMLAKLLVFSFWIKRQLRIHKILF